MRKFHTGLGMMALAGVSLAGCADLRRSVSLPPVNAESPVAAQVRAAAPRNYAVPRLADVPPTPRNVPTAAAVKTSVVSMVRCRGGVTRFALTHPQLSAGTQQFAVAEREVAQVNPADVPPPDSAVRSETEAEQLRAYASPPAAIASGPPPTPDEAKPGTAPAVAPHVRRAPPAHGPVPTPAAAPIAPARPPAAVVPVQVQETPPPLPAPLPDPMLARCS